MCQNEPLMDKDLFKKIRLVKEIGRKGIITMVVTNGNLFTTKKTNELEDSGLDILNFSIDALTEETYNKIRVGLNYKSVLKNIENVLNSNYKNCLLVSFVKQRDNIDELREFKRYWKKKGISTLAFTICNRSGGVRDFENFELQNQDYSILNPFISSIWKKIAKCCITPLAEFIILWNGDVLLCCNDYSKKLVLGNVNDSSIKEIWNGKEYQKIRELHFNGEYKKISICSNCSIKRNNYL
jgi:radical SAM protein with 4Fe4S-binding SPASM domain